MTIDVINEVLEEMGIEVGKNEQMKLSEFIEDSFSLMLFIANLEEKLKIEFPNELLLDVNEITFDELKKIIDTLREVGTNLDM